MRRFLLFFINYALPLMAWATNVVEVRNSFDFFSNVKTANTIYEIKCEVDLKNKTVTLPANSVLRFTSGALKNGTIVGNNTILENTANLPIFDDVAILDSAYQFVNDAIYVDWFAGKSDADKMQRAVNFAKRNRNAIHFLSREYIFDHTVTIPMGQIVLKGSGGGGEYKNLGTRIVASSNFTSNYEGSPLFYMLGEPQKAGQSLGLCSGHITGISFFAGRTHDVFQFLLSNAPSRPLFIDYCRFSGCNAAIRILDNGKSTALGFLYVEHCTMTGNRWNIVAHGRHSILGLYFCKNIAEQCEGNINLGYTETYTSKPYEKHAPQQKDYAASANIVICDNLLEGTVDCIYINGGKCVVNIERNYFETSRKQFVVLSFSNPNSTVSFQNNFISKSDNVQLHFKSCRYSLQKDFSSTSLKTNGAYPIQ